MTTGCLITVSNKTSRIIRREPCWPWPKPDLYPQVSPAGTVYFFPRPYYTFTLGDIIKEHLQK